MTKTEQVKEIKSGKLIEDILNILRIRHCIQNAILPCDICLDKIKSILHTHQSELEKAVREETSEIIKLILPLAKGYTAKNNVGSNKKYIEEAENYLKSLTLKE